MFTRCSVKHRKAHVLFHAAPPAFCMVQQRTLANEVLGLWYEQGCPNAAGFASFRVPRPSYTSMSPNKQLENRPHVCAAVHPSNRGIWIRNTASAHNLRNSQATALCLATGTEWGFPKLEVPFRGPYHKGILPFGGPF